MYTEIISKIIGLGLTLNYFPQTNKAKVRCERKDRKQVRTKSQRGHVLTLEPGDDGYPGLQYATSFNVLMFDFFP